MAGEPLELTADQLDAVTAGSHSPFGTQGTAVVVIAPDGAQGLGTSFPQGFLNLYREHPGSLTETYVIPGAGAATHNPSGEHGSIPQPD